MPKKNEVQDYEDGCNCINCRLARMETQILKMQDDITKLVGTPAKR
ncbi:MAG: hypothetical protein V1934_06735 [Methanobacteriota archaeon]